eukprot:scaffold12605_cov114-Isochrysis_galbana.AAC.5
MPRLPSALGLGGAKRTGGLDWTLTPPMRSDSPSSPNPHRPPPPQAPAPCTLGSYRLEGRRDGLRALLKSFANRVTGQLGTGVLRASNHPRIHTHNTNTILHL